MQFSNISLYAILSCALVAFASPIPAALPESNPEADPTLHTLEKRIDHHGRATWFHPGKGNCGKWNGDNDPIVAIPKPLYDQNKGSNCDQYVEIRYKGKKVYGLTRDSCPTCGDGLDLSPSLFQKLAPLSAGVVNIEWSFKPRGWKP